MPHLNRLYSEAVGRQARPNETKEKSYSPAEDATRKQAKLTWLQSSVTQDILSSMGREMEELVETAMKEAVSYPSHNNHQRIIHLLVRAEEIRKSIQKYARD